MIVKGVTHLPVLDLEGALARLGGDRDLYGEMISIVLEDTPQLLTDLRIAVAAEDPGAIRSRAHALKGLLSGCGGVRAARLAHALEETGGSEQINDSAVLMDSLESETAVLTKVLRNYRA